MPIPGDGSSLPMAPSYYTGLSYISSHSADVILSDIRPTKLKPDALNAINALLDEFLSLILTASGSLSTDKLRASLLGLLPTNLGKEALLEAEVELRAYWERTEAAPTVEDDSRSFHFQWSFELLRLKCSAYSTLNEADEDPASESRVNEIYAKSHPYPPKSALVDPAALYLTAILESVCEHILSNVGRVAARDSSRTSATINDLFVALCEDDSIYGLFKSMKVYEQIELKSKTPKPQRTKSFSRPDRLSISRTSSPQHELTLVNSSAGSKSRQSTDALSVTPVPSSATRQSFEKTRAIRMFANGKALGDADFQSGHRKSRSSSPPDDETTNAEDAAMLREFDDLMRSTSTMKVSLTPDRLKTMDMYKQEKDQRGAIRRPASHFSSNSESTALLNSTQKPALRHVDSIVEDEEGSPKARQRQASVATPSNTLVGASSTRSRSASTSSGVRNHLRKNPIPPPVKAAPSTFSQSALSVDTSQQHPPPPSDKVGFPARKSTKQKNRDTLDLDDVMNGSDDDQETTPVVNQPTSSRSPQTPRRGTPGHVSANTRELMDFLAKGPPEPQLSKSGRELVNFLAEGPPDQGSADNTPDGSKSRSGGRLQRMISKLNLGNVEKGKGDGSKPLIKPGPVRHGLNPKPSTLSSLANRPILPRPPRPISPPSDSSDEKSIRSPLRQVYQDTSFARQSYSTDKLNKPIPAAPTSPMPPAFKDNLEKSTPPLPSPHLNGNGHANEQVAKEGFNDVQPIIPTRSTSYVSSGRKSIPVIGAPPSLSVPEVEMKDVQHLMNNATTADECRLIFDMFLARTGLSRDPKSPSMSYPSPTPSIMKHPTESSLENSLVELLLGSVLMDVETDVPSSKELPDTPLPTGSIDGSLPNTPSSSVPPVIQNSQAIPVGA